MKKLSLMIALVMLFSALALSATTAGAQDEKQAEFERTWYDICYTKKDVEKCYPLSKELIDKYPTSTYIKNAKANVTNYDTTKAWERFNNALKSFYSPPQDAAKLNALFAAGEDYFKFQPDQQYVVAQLALAGANGVLGEVYKNLDRVKAYADKSLSLFASETPPKDWKADEWDTLRDAVRAKMNQFMGYYVVETKGDPLQAIDYLTKATQVRSKDGAGWKDPNNYWLRANIYSKKYGDLRAQYDALTDDEKTGDAGKALLAQVNEVIDQMIPDYARVIATATQAEAKPLNDAARELFDSFWKFRTDDPEKSAAYINSFKVDPTADGPPIPVKVRNTDEAAAPDAVSNGPGPKLTGQGKANGKTSTTNTKPKPPIRRKPGRR